MLFRSLMLAGYLRPGYDYLLERKLPAILREATASPLGNDLARFISATTELGYTRKVAAGLASQVAVRMLIQTGRPLGELDDTDFGEFDAAITAREHTHQRTLQHYHTALNATRTVLHHMDGQVSAAVHNTAHLRWPWRRHFAGVPTPVADSLVAYLDCASGTRTRSTVLGIASRLWAFRPVPRRPRPRVDLAGRPGPATPHRALPGRRGRRPQPAHRRDPIGLRAALAGADRRAAHR